MGMRLQWVWVLALGVLLGAGSVRMRDGKVYEGEVRLDDGAVVVRAAGATEVRLAWGEIRRAVLVARESPKMIRSAAGGSLPEGWKNQDIGEVHKPGAASCDEKGLFEIKASGWGAWGPEDSFHYVYRSWEGDGQIIARVVKLDDAPGAMGCGIVVRQSLVADSAMAGTSVQASGEVRLTRRPVGNAPDFRRAEEVAGRPWIRLTRRGDVFGAYCSRDGRFWELMESQTIEMKDPVLVGLGGWSTGNAWVGRVPIDSVMTVAGRPGMSWFGDGDRLMEGVVLRDGTVLAGEIRAADEAGVKLVRAGDVETVVPLKEAARLIFNPAPPELAKMRGKQGVLLASGDFIEGEVMGVGLRDVAWPRPKQLHVGVRSLLFGVKYFEAAKEVIGVVMGEVNLAGGDYEVISADGSLRRAKRVEVKKGGVEVDGVVAGDVVEVGRE